MLQRLVSCQDVAGRLHPLYNLLGRIVMACAIEAIRCSAADSWRGERWRRIKWPGASRSWSLGIEGAISTFKVEWTLRCKLRVRIRRRRLLSELRGDTGEIQDDPALFRGFSGINPGWAPEGRLDVANLTAPNSDSVWTASHVATFERSLP